MPITARKLERSLKNASSYKEWSDTALLLDKLKGRDRWRHTDASSQYDYRSIRNRLETLRSLKNRGDIRGLLFVLNEGIHGNMGGMGKAGLYGHALTGTKYLITSYIDEISDSLSMIKSDDSGDISPSEKLDFFERASHCFGRTGLMMSGSGSLLYFHAGVIKALLEAELLPSVLSGSSGGSLIGSVVCSHTDDELREMFDVPFFLENLRPKGKPYSVMSQTMLYELLADYIPDVTFDEAEKISGRSMNVSVAPARAHQTSRLLNATTTPSVLIRKAVLASCAVPGIFPPVTLEARDDRGHKKAYLPYRQWVDGSMSDDLPAKRLARLYGVNHFIVSQTNPHVLPFVTDGLRKQTVGGILLEASRRSGREWFNAWTSIVARMDKKGGRLAQGIGMMRSVINQDYVGDINILPDYRYVNLKHILNQPGAKDVERLINTGARCTWPKLEMIRQQTRISKQLDSILEELTNKAPNLHSRSPGLRLVS